MITRTSLKNILVWVLVLALMLPLIPAVTHADTYGFSEMYVKTDNGKKLAVRAQPNKNAEIIGYAQYGQQVAVDWSYAGNDGWSKLVWGSLGDGFVQTRYLVSEKPAPYQKPTKAPATPKPTTDPKKEAAELKKQQDALNKELKSEKEIEPCYIAVRPSRSTGMVNFRVGPSTITTKITTFPSGKELIALGETKNWWRARDPETGKVGYIFKNLTVKLDKKLVTEEAQDATQKLGKLSVNGEFELICKLPVDYKIQVVDMKGERIFASILSDDMTKPEMYLRISYDELYGEVDRMNDMSAEDLAVLENSFTSDNEVEISYRETGYGTKLLVAKEIGSGEDSVSILSVYKGYLVEFEMTPSPNAANQTLNEEQIQMCIDFLTNVDFNPIKN